MESDPPERPNLQERFQSRRQELLQKEPSRLRIVTPMEAIQRSIKFKQWLEAGGDDEDPKSLPGGDKLPSSDQQ
jgi:hypothetical protein